MKKTASFLGTVYHLSLKKSIKSNKSFVKLICFSFIH